MEFDAVILAGGRSSRLGGTPKAALRFRGDTLLERSLLAAAGARSVAVSADGRIQPLAGLYDTAALQRSVADAARHGTLVGGSLFGLLASLDLRTVPVPPGSTDDVDTWADAQALGVARPGVAGNGSGRPHTT